MARSPELSGGSPREGARSELASEAATGGGGLQAPPTRMSQHQKARMRAGHLEPLPRPGELQQHMARMRAGHLSRSPDPEDAAHESASIGTAYCSQA